MILWLLLACTQSPDPTPNCADLSSVQERDQCRYQAFTALEPTRIDDAFAQAGAFEDPIVRGAAVVGWVQKNSREISQDGGERLCEILEKTSEQAACKRRFSAAHLQR